MEASKEVQNSRRFTFHEDSNDNRIGVENESETYYFPIFIYILI